MALLLILFGLLSIVELLTCTRWLWAVHRPLSAAVVIGLAGVSGGLCGLLPAWQMAVIALVSLYRVFNLLRLVESRSEEHYLRRSSFRTSLLLMAAQAAIALVWILGSALQLTALSGWYLLAVTQLLLGVGLWASTHRQLRKLTPPAIDKSYSDHQLPSLSVCIPARNETSALEQCLKSLVTSDYPKLEILVLDDCSQGGKTSDIIRSFAHQGVRFIQGSPPGDNWLAKNWAYQQLYEAASGQLVLFCGVDIRFERQSLRSLVSTQLFKHKRMISLLPRNLLTPGLQDSLGALIQPARYAWEVCLPRRQLNRPAVLSSCWIAERSLISSAGGFAAISGSISPEAHFAKRALVADSYSFVASTPELAISSHKSVADQWDTAVRTRYPQLHKRPEMVALVSAAELGMLFGPLPLAVGALVASHVLLTAVSGLSFVFQSVVYGSVVNLTYRRRLVRGPLLLVPAALLDVYARHESMWRYEFGEVTWKGRNVCLPLMRVIPRLPRA